MRPTRYASALSSDDCPSIILKEHHSPSPLREPNGFDAGERSTDRKLANTAHQLPPAANLLLAWVSCFELYMSPALPGPCLSSSILP